MSTPVEDVFSRYEHSQVILLGELRRDKDGRLVVELNTRKENMPPLPAENLVMGIRDNADNGERFPFEGMETAKCSNCKQCTSGLCGALDFIESAKEDEESAESCPFYIPDEEEAENQRKNPESYIFYTGDEP